jgi:hypothetical protein
MPYRDREALIIVAKEIVSQVMSSITKGDAALLEKLLRVLKQNAQSV